MPSFPQPGTVTICEINRELVTADHLGDDQAKETYAKILGTVFSPIPFESDSLLGTGTEHESVELRNGSLGILSSGLEALLSGSLRPLLQPADVKRLKDIDLHSVSWHNHKQILAFVSAPHQVTICDYNDSDGKLPCVLSHESQKDVKILEWRPNGGKTLSVACKGGICIWAASYPGNVPSVRSGVASNPLSRGSVTRWTLVDFLLSSDFEQISALSWSPDGRYLASASYESSAFTIWDVSQGLATPIRRGLGGISLLKWSPSGDYFFSAKFDGTFYLWETNTWTSEPWSSKNGFVMVNDRCYFSASQVDSYDFVFNIFGRSAGHEVWGATWDPDGSMVLLSFSESSSLGSIHFTSKPPSLDAHLIPVELPEIKLLTDSRVIEKIAWDASGERLAVSCRDGDELYKGLIAVFDVKRTPLISTSLVGFIRGPGDNPKPVAFSFHDKFKQGPLLSVCWNSGFCCTYPLIFRSNILP